MPNLIDYIRGKENTSFRNRRLDFIPSFANDADDVAATTASDGLEPWLLGDIVHSSPLVVGTPKSAYDRFYGDDTYTTFRTQYANRRNVVYVGANDGMLHAFNLGKFDASTGQYIADANYALGAELWAYVPFNLLPHLKWLAEKSYQHNYYMDGPPKSYDVNIFNNDSDHPGGWGTILIAPMRTGGAPYTVDSDGDGSKDRTLHSAVVVMDITNPDKAPQLLAEIALPDNTYTTVNPDVVKIRTRGSDYKFNGPGATNQWYLALASGVTDAKRFTSTKAPRLYLYDLSVSNGIKQVSNVALTSSLGSVGGINARDWNGDFKDDYLYLGTVEGSVDNQAGQLLRVSVHAGGVLGTPTAVLSVTNQTFAATPFTVVDKKGNYWVFTGTGRYYS
ncbi:MAG: transcriptional regulator, partial [Moraxellaceae bacterium]